MIFTGNNNAKNQRHLTNPRIQVRSGAGQRGGSTRAPLTGNKYGQRPLIKGLSPPTKTIELFFLTA
jgi:hypothetical protein